MKKTIFFLLIFISLQLIYSKHSYSQDYYPLTGEEKHWIVALPDEYGIGYWVGLWEYYMTGDTIIEDQNYKKIYHRNLVITENQAPPFQGANDYELFGVIREDFEERKVYAQRFMEWGWVADCGLNEEYLMYDFSVEVDDTADFCTMDHPSVIANIQEDNYFETQTKIFYPYENHEYMEGIGSVIGLYELMLILVKKDYHQLPHLAYYCPNGDCDVLLGNKEEIQANKLKVLPNPASDYVSFSISGSNENLVQIYNIKAQLMDELRGGAQIRWNCMNAIPGVYFYKVISKSNISSGKIIVK